MSLQLIIDADLAGAADGAGSVGQALGFAYPLHVTVLTGDPVISGDTAQSVVLVVTQADDTPVPLHEALGVEFIAATRPEGAIVARGQVAVIDTEGRGKYQPGPYDFLRVAGAVDFIVRITFAEGIQTVPSAGPAQLTVLRNLASGDLRDVPRPTYT